MNREPLVVCLCPTAYAPWFIPNIVAMFQAQDHPNKKLVILDDTDLVTEQEGDGWILHSTPERISSLPKKYNRMLELAGDFDVAVVMEQDDVFLPWHCSSHVAAINATGYGWSHPAFVWTDRSGSGPARPLAPEPTGHARLHGALAITRETLDKIGGWVDTDCADFDVQMMAKLRESGPPADPTHYAAPSYMFRWATTNTPHGQSFGRSRKDTEWYTRAGDTLRQEFFRKVAANRWKLPIGRLTPQFDSETAGIYNNAGWLKRQWDARG